MTTGCCWPLLPVRPPRDGAFFVRSPAGVNGATLQENAPEASVGWSFAVTSRLFFQSRGPVEDDGNGRGNKKPPACAGGSCSCSRVAAYRLAWRLAPPLGPLLGPLPRMSPLETSLTQSEPLPL
jgi:hypothetical protein